MTLSYFLVFLFVFIYTKFCLLFYCQFHGELALQLCTSYNYFRYQQTLVCLCSPTVFDLFMEFLKNVGLSAVFWEGGENTLVTFHCENWTYIPVLGLGCLFMYFNLFINN